VTDKIILRIAAVDWTGWKSVEISRQMDAVAGSFSLSLADRSSPDGPVLPLAAGLACEILIGDDPVIKGWINKTSPSFSATDHGIAVSGRDASADLVDCSAVHSPGHFLNQDCLRLASVLAKPFGVPVAAEGELGAAIPSFKLEQGETAFEALNRALVQRELLACPDGRGGLVLLKVGSRANDVALAQGVNILSASADYDETDRFSRYLVQSQVPGSDDSYGLKACGVVAEVTDAAITRYAKIHFIRIRNRPMLGGLYDQRMRSD